MTSQAVMKRYLTSVAKNNEEYKDNKSMQTLSSLIANYKNLDAEDKEVLDAKIESAYNKLQAKGVTASKSTSKATTTRRTKSSSDGGLKEILAELKKKLGAEKFKDATRGTDIKKDIQIPALKKGKRIVRKKGYTTNQYGKFKNKIGTAYWESRANRYDANQPSQTRKYKLADGGKMDWKADKNVSFDNYKLWIVKGVAKSGDAFQKSFALHPKSNEDDAMSYVYSIVPNIKKITEIHYESKKFAKGGEVFGAEKFWNELSSKEKMEWLKKRRDIPSDYKSSLSRDSFEKLPDWIKSKVKKAFADNKIYKYGQGGKVSNIDDEIATQELKEEVKSKMKKGDAVIHFAFTDYGGDFIDKVAIEYFEENYPKNIVVENTAYFGKNAFVFGKPAEEWIEASEDYILGFEDFESFYYEKINEAEQEGFEDYLGDLERDGYEFDMGEVLSWLMENKGGYYNVTTQGLDFSYGDITDELLEEGLIRKEEYAKGGKLSSKAKYIPKRDIAEIEVEKNGKSKSIDGANLLDGVYVKKGTKYAKGGNIESGSAHIYITMTNGDYKIYHGDDVRLKANAKPLHTFKNAKEGTWMKIWELLNDKQFARGGNVGKMTEAEKEQAEKELRESWEGKNIDDYVMYSDKYKKGGRMAKGGEIEKIQVGDYVIVKNNPYWEGGLGSEKSYRRKVKMISGEGEDKDFFFTDGSNSSSKYVHSIKKHAKGGTTKRIKRKGC